MATGPLSIKLRCASWQQLATIYKRDLSRGAMFLKAATQPPVGTPVRIDLTLPSASVIVLSGEVDQHLADPQRGSGVEIKLAPIPAGTIWMIESALASEAKRTGGAPSTGSTGPVPAVSDGNDVAAAEQELIKALLSEAESMKKLNPFLVLGVGYEAGDADVRSAFGELTKRYHPDRFARYESAELRQVAAEIFILIRDAYRRLGDETGRAQALATINRPAAAKPAPPRAQTPPVGTPIGGPPKPPPKPGAIARAPGEPAGRPTPIPAEAVGRATPPHGERALSGPVDPSARTAPMPGARPNQPGARPEPAQKRAPSEPVPPIVTDRRPMVVTPPPVFTDADAGSVDELLAAGKYSEALAAYKVLAKKHPQDRSFRAGIELCEGLRALSQRDRLEAAQRFEAALEIDPSNEHAARELADMRRQATNERKGLLSRLMGKKES